MRIDRGWQPTLYSETEIRTETRRIFGPRADEIVNLYLARKDQNPEEYPYTLPNLDIEEYIRNHPGALEISDEEAREKMGQAVVFVLGGGKPNRIGGQTLQLLHQLDKSPRTIIHYQSSQREAKELKIKLGRKALETVQANLGNFNEVQAMFAGLEEIGKPNILINAAAPYKIDSKEDLDPVRAEVNFSGILLAAFYSLLCFVRQNLGRPALAFLLTDWCVETKAAHESSFGLYRALSYFVAKGGVEMLIPQLRIGQYNQSEERVIFDPTVDVRIVGNLRPGELKHDAFVWQIEASPVPSLEYLLTCEDAELKRYVPVIEAYLRRNVLDLMLQATEAVKQGRQVIIVRPDERDWLGLIVLKGVAGLQEVFASNDLCVVVIAPGPTLPWEDISQEEIRRVAFYSSGWSGAGPIAETIKDSIVEFLAGKMQGKRIVKASDREVIAVIRKMTGK